MTTGTRLTLRANNGTITLITLTVRKESVPECIREHGKFYLLELSDDFAGKYDYREIIPRDVFED